MLCIAEQILNRAWRLLCRIRQGCGDKSALAVIIVVGLIGGCAAPDNARRPARDTQVVGEPPSADDDPFSVKTMPGEAVAAKPRGSIGQKDDPADTPSSSSTQKKSATTASSGDSPVAEKNASKHAPGSGDESTDKPQCFSCVRICPADESCDASNTDVICGWGVHQSSAQAQKMARAECDATLDMARQMPVWSQIAGQCPAATCR